MCKGSAGHASTNNDDVIAVIPQSTVALANDGGGGGGGGIPSLRRPSLTIFRRQRHPIIVKKEKAKNER